MKLLAQGLAVLAWPLSAIAQQSSDLPPDFARLVPKEAVVFVRLSSLDELAAPLERLRAAFAPKDEPATPLKLLKETGFFGDPQLVDTKGPMGFALIVSPDAPQPVPVFIVKTSEPESFVASLAPPWKDATAVSGSFVSMSLGATSPPSDEPKRLLQGLSRGLVVARLDFATLIETFRPLIDMGLLQAESMLASPQSTLPFDVGGFFQYFIELASDFLDSAQSLDLGLDVRGTAVELSGTLTIFEGSPLAECARPEEVDYRELAARLDPSAFVQVATTFDTSEYMEQELDLYASMLEWASEQQKLPRELAEAGCAIIAALKELQPNLGDASVTSFDVGATGVRGSVAYRAPDPEALVRDLGALFDHPALSKIGIRIGEPSTIEVFGTAIARRRANVDLDSLMLAVPDPKRPHAEELETAARVLEALLGPDGLQIALGPRGDWVICVVGGDDAYLTGAVERFSKPPGSVPAVLVPAVDKLRGANPGFFIRYDVGRLMDGIDEVGLALAIDPETEDLGSGPAGVSFPLLVWTGIDGRCWKGGLMLDLDALVRFAQASNE